MTFKTFFWSFLTTLLILTMLYFIRINLIDVNDMSIEYLYAGDNEIYPTVVRKITIDKVGNGLISINNEKYETMAETFKIDEKTMKQLKSIIKMNGFLFLKNLFENKMCSDGRSSTIIIKNSDKEFGVKTYCTDNLIFKNTENALIAAIGESRINQFVSNIKIKDV
ncbi:MAG: hypothetical protein IJB71_04530 [Bacilli bacterium]|nr:hypothetical protein [Bacilli bacterium]